MSTYNDDEWQKKLKELEYWEHRAANATSKNKFKPFIDSMGEIIDRKLVIKQEALDAFRVGRAGKKLERRKKKLTAPERLYQIEVEESLLNALTALVDLYKVLPSQLISNDESDLITFIKERRIKLRDNINHKKDRIERPEVYTDINRRYNTQKRER